MSYTHFTMIERTKIETLLEMGYSIRRIADLLNRVASSISRELKRNPNVQAKKSQKNDEQKKPHCVARLELTRQIKVVIREKLYQTWSSNKL